jgi:predicted nucleotidyltransferase
MGAREHAIQAALAAEPAVQVALLFGSRARGQARPDSDFDVALFVDPALEAEARLRLRTRLIAALAPAIPIDVVILNDAPVLLAHRALQGRLLVHRPSAEYTSFFVRTLAEAGDERYWNDLHARERQRRLAGGHFGRP